VAEEGPPVITFPEIALVWGLLAAGMEASCFQPILVLQLPISPQQVEHPILEGEAVVAEPTELLRFVKMAQQAAPVSSSSATQQQHPLL
jgi:hypothetical protein